MSGPGCAEPACRPGPGRYRRHALILSALTVGYNVVEGVVSLAFGAAAGSAALIGFGLDSFMESMSGGVMLWRFGRRWSSPDHEARAERRAVTLVGLTFFVFAGYVLYESARKLALAEQPDPNLPGIVIALVSIVTMPALFLVKRRVARRLNSPSLAADSKQTLACSLLSVALLLGLGLNRLFGLWQADPAVGLLTGLWLAREGITTLRERRLCAC